MTYTLNLNHEQAEQIVLLYQSFEIDNDNIYVFFRAKIHQSTLTLYKTNKLVLQGLDCSALYESICETFNIQCDITPASQPNITFELSTIGTDEVGTGDYFGGITVCACFVPKDKLLMLRKLGVRDSKKITDKKILEIGPQLINDIMHSIILLNNEKYNRIIKIGSANLNKIKAVMHNKAIIKLLKQKPQYDNIIIDGFTSKEHYFSYLENQNDVVKNVQLIEKAEDKYTSVAVASIIARYYFLKHKDELNQTYGYQLPNGAGAPVDLILKKIINDKKDYILPFIAKINFRNTVKVNVLLDKEEKS